jgi:hypothetical protein
MSSLCCSGNRTSVEQLPSETNRPVTVSLRKYQGLLRSVRLTVAGDSVDVLFDTGGGWTLISPRLAERTSCRPTGRNVGFRMTGERLDVPHCSNELHFAYDTWRSRVDAGVFDLMKLLPGDWPPLDGVISLKTFSGRAITLDLGHDRLIIETPSSFSSRIAMMTPIRSRIATGDDGSSLVLFVSATIGGSEYWLEFDSGNLDAVLLAPHTARAAGVAAGEQGSDIALTLAPAVTVTSKARSREMIYDGALNASVIGSRIFTIDLATGRAWVSP